MRTILPTPPLFIFLMLAATVAAQDTGQGELPTPEQLTGEWIYMARAERDSPDDRTPVGVIVQFRADGTTITKTATRELKGTYVIDGDTIIYSGPDRKETWRVRSFEPGKALTVESGSLLLFLERR